LLGVVFASSNGRGKVTLFSPNYLYSLINEVKSCLVWFKLCFFFVQGWISHSFWVDNRVKSSLTCSSSKLTHLTLIIILLFLIYIIRTYWILPSCCWVKLLNGFHVGFYKRKLHPLKLVSILTNVINFNPNFVTFITTSIILLNLFMELILSLTHRTYYYFYYLFISFHIESPLLIGVFLSFFFSMILCLRGGLQQTTFNSQITFSTFKKANHMLYKILKEDNLVLPYIKRLLLGFWRQNLIEKVLGRRHQVFILLWYIQIFSITLCIIISYPIRRSTLLGFEPL
jgi:hypothetical protein